MLNNAALLMMFKKADEVVQVACTDNETWCVTKSGKLFGCGRGHKGQQGNGKTYSVKTFTKCADDAIQVACSLQTTWYVTKSGELYGCGYGVLGGQGNGATSNVITFTRRAGGVVQVACSDNTTWYVTKSGELYGCGSGIYGQQGNGQSGSGRIVNAFTKRADDAIQAICNSNVTWYVTKSGELYGCGEGDYGQQGNGSTDNVATFTKRA